MSIVFPQNDTAPKGSLYGADTINGYKYAEVPSGEHYILNSAKTLQDALPDGSKDPKGPYGNWRGAEETCSLTWEFHYWTICSKQPSDATLIQSGVGKRSGKMNFTIRPGAKLPVDAPEAQPCNLEVKAAASSLADAAVSPTTWYAGTRTSSTAATATAKTTSSAGPHGTSGRDSSKDGSNKDSLQRLGSDGFHILCCG
ncbi:hypothetical protein BM221_010593 [Beauveria bassiana]|uniref:Uncharacterized protein n=1 Tax=Beauveria bassiana TaxID=176275 RepID=A0A2N6N8L3_BEABA|nr:hypothetical protein BM221_010593 [Beauveria bassiana]